MPPFPLSSSLPTARIKVLSSSLEHCIDDDEKVEFSFELRNEQFKQKLDEIYPRLENASFVFMKADKNNKLEELNAGKCCYHCYTPENVYHSERGQGRLYIKIIAEDEVCYCSFFGISVTGTVPNRLPLAKYNSPA